MMRYQLIAIITILCILSTLAEAQSDSTKLDKQSFKNCEPQAVGDLLRKKGKPRKPPRKSSILVLPMVSYNPTNGLIFGVGGALGWYMGPKETTRISASPFTVAFTSKQQLITFIKPNIFTKDNEYFFQGDLRFYVYSQPTYGLGTNSPDTINMTEEINFMGQGASKDSVLFPMKYNYAKVHIIVNKRITDNFYGGIGLHFDYLYNIKDEYYHPATDSTPELNTPHNYYSVANDFSLTQNMMNGASLNFIYDSRDNQINPYKGYYANINYRMNPTFLGSDQNSTVLWLEFRTYIGLSERMPRHLIAFWAIGNFNLTGEMPYMTLPSLGEDQRARSGRGYTNGRFRGMDIIYTEVEYRFPISQCTQILGGVLFVNATTTSNTQTGVGLFEYVRPAVGFGIRVMVNKHFRTNINLDIAIGKDAKGFYFSGQETF